jgi:hypothetical protein
MQPLFPAMARQGRGNNPALIGANPYQLVSPFLSSMAMQTIVTREKDVAAKL